MDIKSKEAYKYFITNYWNYYRELEDEFLQTKKYVDFSKDNFHAYSVEFLKLFQAVCSEIDVIGKAMAFLINKNFCQDDRKNNIYKWWYEIQDEFFVDDKIQLSDYTCNFFDSLEIKPWSDFAVEKKFTSNNRLRHSLKSGASIPHWWADYNKVKHNRTSRINSETETTNYRKANLGNLIHAFAALYTLEMAYMTSVGTKSDLQAFTDISKMFAKFEFATSQEVMELFAKG